VLLVASLIAGAGALLALRLEPSAATDTLVGRGTPSYQATAALHRRFGDDPIAVLVRGEVKDLVLTANLGKLVGLEGCLSGNKPDDVAAPGGPEGPCGRLAATKPVQVVFGPGTFLNSAVNEIATQLQAQLQNARTTAQQAAVQAERLARRRGASPAEARQIGQAASQAVVSRFQQQLLTIATRYGLSATAANPRLDNPDFIYSLVFDPTRGAYQPKARFAYLFPNQDSALISVRLKPSLSDAQRSRAIALVREAVAMPRWKLDNASYLVSGAPVVVSDVTRSLSDSLVGLLIGGLLMMALVLPLVFRGRRYRMLPLAVALGAAGTVFGLMSLLGARLTLASIAVLPVLLGLGVDYAIQYQARLEEDGLNRAIRLALPTIGIAVLATVAGFAVLLLSPVPMVRGFGLVLMGGVVLAFFFALSAGTAALAALSRRSGGGPLSASVRGAGDLASALGRPFARPAAAVGRGAGAVGRRVTGLSLRRPVLVLALGALLAVGGWVVDSRTEVVSDITQLVPRDLPAVRDVLELQKETNIAGEVDVLVSADDLTDPKVVGWMRSFQDRLKKRFDYSSTNGCGQAELCPAVSLTDLFRTQEASADQDRIRALLDAVPAYFSQAVITPDRRYAVMSFGIKLLPLDRQQEVLDAVRDELEPPEGVRARLAGLPVLAAEANAKLTDPARRLGTLLAGLFVVGLALLAVYRRWARAWVPLVPIALATGWSALVLWALGVPLNPMSATLGALVIAISTEFAVLLVARFREEREAGLDVQEALARTYASTGTAVLASGITAIAGFAVLAFSDVQMLKDFGRVTVVDLSVSLLGVLAVLPAVLTLAERRAARRAPAAPAREAVRERELALSGGERSETR
jgi:hydrophobe/amphiphile efflux-3 (HAE3) family protein